MDNCVFSLEHYDYLMNMIVNNKYQPVFFNEATFSGKEILLRHDIDLDLISALNIAQIENSHNIRSTFFIWLSSPFYNILEPLNRDAINSILRMGHQIGLHFYEGDYDLNIGSDLTSYVKKEAEFLEMIFQTKVHAVSFHIPSKAILLGEYKLSKEFINTYHEDFFKKIKYTSDSSMHWREGCLCKLLESGTAERIQALMHPIWWQQNNFPKHEIMDKYSESKKQKFYKELCAVAPFYYPQAADK